jgi:putative ABC transport system substrate-binding protein
MRELGWIEGRNISYDRAFADNDHSRLPALAAELIKRNPEVIFAPPSPAAAAAGKATRSIPIIFSLNVDPVSVGLVRSLARPEGNATGVTYAFGSTMPKRVEVLKEMLPQIKTVGLLFDPSDSGAVVDLRALRNENTRLGIALLEAPVRSAGELDAALDSLLRKSAQAVLITGTLLYNLRHRVLGVTLARGIPTTGATQFTEEGALFSYGFSLRERIRRAAYYVDRILKGAKPGDLPVEQISKVELVINLKVAKELGIRVPHAMLLRADRVIE